MNKKITQIAFVLLAGVLLNLLSYQLSSRIDLTADKRYTLSKVTTNLLDSIDNNILINVYLEGDFPAEFQRLQTETRLFLEELKATNPNLTFRFINPNNNRASLIKRGMIPSQLTVEEDGKLSEAIIFPWAEIWYGKKSIIVPLLTNALSKSQEEQLQRAISNLEFSFTEAFNILTQKESKKVAVLSGNGELADVYLYSFLSEVTKKYRIAKFTLDSVAVNPQKTLKELKKYDAVIIAKPTERFTDAEKLTLDQFIVNGGKSLWMIDTNVADTDSLYNQGKMLAYPRDLNLTDLLFSYGVRINTAIVQDLYAAKLKLASGNLGNQTQFEDFSWFYHPLATTNPNHPITKNVLPVRLRFATQIDTLKNSAIQKTPLLVSSVLSRKIGTPVMIELNSIANEPKQEDFVSGNQLLGVLLEGAFTSAYANRIKPFKVDTPKEKSDFNKMIVISDGDVVKNQILKGKPYNLSVDKWTRERFGNKEFLLNALDYLLDDSGLINLRSKSITLRNLDKQQAYHERSFWQFITVGLPLILLSLLGFGLYYLRTKQYSH